MSDKAKYILEAEERDRRAELRYQDFLRRGVMPSAKKPVFEPAEDIDSNAWMACPDCGWPILYGMTRHMYVCEKCDWYFFSPKRAN